MHGHVGHSYGDDGHDDMGRQHDDGDAQEMKLFYLKIPICGLTTLLAEGATLVIAPWTVCPPTW